MTSCEVILSKRLHASGFDDPELREFRRSAEISPGVSASRTQGRMDHLREIDLLAGQSNRRQASPNQTAKLSFGATSGNEDVRMRPQAPLDEILIEVRQEECDSLTPRPVVSLIEFEK